MSVFIIAEAGANHNRDLRQAFSLIDAAKEAGADAVKFQTYSSSTLYAKNAPDFAGYENINKLIEEIELPRSWQGELKTYCDRTGIEFMSTPFDEAAVKELVDLGIKRLKISGFESSDPRFVKMVASTGLPIIVSIGIGSNINSIEEVISWIGEVQANPDITILHCNNAYPTPPEDINLNRIDNIVKKFPNIKVGLSDHTLGIAAPTLAVAKGVQCIEKHFTLSRRLPGPDHPFALEPEELKCMVDNIRLAEVMCNDTDLVFTKSEAAFQKAMRSVVAKRNIRKGELLTEDNLTTKRPRLENSVSAKHFYKTIGQRALRFIEKDELIMVKDFEREI